MSSKTETSYHVWDDVHGYILSRKGGWRIGQGVFNQGYSMMDDLVGNASYMQVVMLNATGRLPERRLADWVEAAHICLSWPDPRIWCNQIGALAGSARTGAVAATVAGALASDSRIYGPYTLIGAVEFIQHALARFHEGRSVEEIVREECAKHAGKPHIMGFARPIAKGDERIPALERVGEDLGYKPGEHLQLAYAIERTLMQDFDEGMNVGGYMSAFMADQGFTAQQVYDIFPVLVFSGVTACYVDSRERPAGTFYPLKCGDIDYQGKPPRELPE